MSVSIHAQEKEWKESTALGEVSTDTFSDTGSTPVASTRGRTGFDGDAEAGIAGGGA